MQNNIVDSDTGISFICSHCIIINERKRSSHYGNYAQHIPEIIIRIPSAELPETHNTLEEASRWDKHFH